MNNKLKDLLHSFTDLQQVRVKLEAELKDLTRQRAQKGTYFTNTVIQYVTRTFYDALYYRSMYSGANRNIAILGYRITNYKKSQPQTVHSSNNATPYFYPSFDI